MFIIYTMIANVSMRPSPHLNMTEKQVNRAKIQCERVGTENEKFHV